MTAEDRLSRVPTPPIGEAPGVGPAAVRDFARLGVSTFAELLTLLPRDYEDRKTPRRLSSLLNLDAAGEGTVNTTVEIISHEYFGPQRTLKIRCTDGSGDLSLLCFGRNWLARSLREGTRHRLYADVSLKFGELQASSFDAEPESTPDARSRFGLIFARYPLAGKLTQQRIRKAMDAALTWAGAHLLSPPEQPLLEDLRGLHLPTSLDAAEAARRALADSGLLAAQLAALLRAKSRRQRAAPRIRVPGQLREKLLAGLPFSLTPGQRAAIAEIDGDLHDGVMMSRLLQADVGAGKTLVAVLAALPVMEAGGRVVMLCPTELLARQHAQRIGPWLQECGLSLGLLSRRANEHSGDGEDALGADFVVATHSVLQPSRQPEALDLVIVDEQHRFGVAQRSALLERARCPRLLSLSATPIPRTLTLTLFGDSDVSEIRDRPPGRQPVETHLALIDRVSKVYDFVRRELAAGNQAFFVYPRLEDGNDDVRNAIAMEPQIAAEFPDHAVGLVHGKMSEDDQMAVMEAFRDGDIRVLVATTVVEVGIDVPGATVMVIEHAERFGLASLHQLRGRVGRGSKRGYCMLTYRQPLTDSARARLLAMKDESDGFRLAERDLELRGPGDTTGYAQSGWVRFAFSPEVPAVADLLRLRARAEALIATRGLADAIPPRERAFLRIWGEPGQAAAEPVA